MYRRAFYLPLQLRVKKCTGKCSRTYSGSELRVLSRIRYIVTLSIPNQI